MIVADWRVFRMACLKSYSDAEKGLDLAEVFVADQLCRFVSMSHCRWTQQRTFKRGS